MYIFTLLAVAVPPVNASSAVWEETPGPNSPVRVPTEAVISKTFARISLYNTGHVVPAHAFHAWFGCVYKSLVKASFPFALNTVGERRPVTTGDEQQRAEGEEKPTSHIHHDQPVCHCNHNNNNSSSPVYMETWSLSCLILSFGCYRSSSESDADQ